MHYVDGKKQIHKTVSVNAQDIESFQQLKKHNVKCRVQGVPTESATDIFELL